MINTVKQDILNVLKQAADSVVKQDAVLLAELSNHTIHNASIYQDEDSISVAVLVYSLSKLIQREKGVFNGHVAKSLRNAHNLLVHHKVDAYRGIIRSILDEISFRDSQMRLYIEEVLDMARIKKGSKLYEHGLSAAKAAQMLGISQWELLNYIGKTRMTDAWKDTKGIRRITFAKKLFGL